jgi:hypothetical protein
MAGLLVANEFERFRSRGLALRATMLSLCAASWFICVVPIALGWLGRAPFLLALALSGLALHGLERSVRDPRVPARQLRQLRWPALGTHLGFALLYFLNAVPPVPLSISYLGIYRTVERAEGRYRLGYARPAWKFWQNGDQSFAWREGDQLIGFARIFSPAGFRDQVQVRWLRKDPRRGWEPQDAIPITISGGREQGFRGYTVKKHFQPGQWRFQVETSDSREIGRLYFEVYPEGPDAPARELRYDLQ